MKIRENPEVLQGRSPLHFRSKIGDSVPPELWQAPPAGGGIFGSHFYLGYIVTRTLPVEVVCFSSFLTIGPS